MHLVDILFAVHWLSFSWHFFTSSNSDYLNRNAFLCYCFFNNNNNSSNHNNKLRCLCLTEMKKDGTQSIMVSSLTGAVLWRMQLTFPYNTQLGAVPYRMIMKQCISSTFLFVVRWLSFSWHFFTASNSDYVNLNAFLCYCFKNNNN